MLAVFLNLFRDGESLTSRRKASYLVIWPSPSHRVVFIQSMFHESLWYSRHVLGCPSGNHTPLENQVGEWKLAIMSGNFGMGTHTGCQGNSKEGLGHL